MRLLITLFLCLAAPAWAQCVESQMPAFVDGNAASADQMRAALADARAFIAQSGIYQDCVRQDLALARAQAAAEGKTVDPAAEVAAKARIAASQQAQDRVGQASNAALTTYKMVHAN